MGIGLKALTTGSNLFEVSSLFIKVQVNVTFGSDFYSMFRYKSSVYNFFSSCCLTFSGSDLLVKP